MGRGNADHLHAGGTGGFDSHVRILEHHTAPRRQAELAGGNQENFGIGFAKGGSGFIFGTRAAEKAATSSLRIESCNACANSHFLLPGGAERLMDTLIYE